MSDNPFGDFIDNMNLDGIEPQNAAEGNDPNITIEPDAEPEDGLRATIDAALQEFASPDPDDLNDAIAEILDDLPNPNETNFWEGKLTDIGRAASGHLVNEVFASFVEGHFNEWMPKAERFATMDDYLYAKDQAVAKIKYLIGFCTRLQSVVESGLRRRFGDV